MRELRDLTILGGMTEAETAAAEEAHLRGLRARYPDKIAHIQALWRKKTSRKQLIARYGQDLTDMAIADLVG